MVASFLEEKDYVNPEAFEPSIENTIIDEFLISERYPQLVSLSKPLESGGTTMS